MNRMLLLQLFQAPRATSTRSGGVRLNWTQADGGGEVRERERESVLCGRPYRKLEPSDGILSPSHAKKLAIYFISTACGRPKMGWESGSGGRKRIGGGETGSAPGKILLRIFAQNGRDITH